MRSGNPCQASRGHSITLAFSMSGLQDSRFEFADFVIQRGSFEGPSQGLTRARGIDDGIDPQTSGGVARIGLMLVRCAHRFVWFLLLFLVVFFAFALELLQFDFV